jgi:hypothetical protein
MSRQKPIFINLFKFCQTFLFERLLGKSKLIPLIVGIPGFPGERTVRV